MISLKYYSFSKIYATSPMSESFLLGEGWVRLLGGEWCLVISELCGQKDTWGILHLPGRASVLEDIMNFSLHITILGQICTCAYYLSGKQSKASVSRQVHLMF